MSLVSEAEYGSFFHNGQKAAPILVTLHEMGHSKPATSIQVDNFCAAGIANNEVKKKIHSNGQKISLDPQ